MSGRGQGGGEGGASTGGVAGGRGSTGAWGYPPHPGQHYPVSPKLFLRLLPQRASVDQPASAAPGPPRAGRAWPRDLSARCLCTGAPARLLIWGPPVRNLEVGRCRSEPPEERSHDLRKRCCRAQRAGGDPAASAAPGSAAAGGGCVACGRPEGMNRAHREEEPLVSVSV